MQKLICVGIGGLIGSCLRYIISTNTPKLFNQIPFGTLIVNILGGLLIGFIMELSLHTNFISDNSKLFLTTGLMGGLTTFSTFSYETIGLLEKGSYIFGALNISLNLFLSLLGVIIGKSLITLIK